MLRVFYRLNIFKECNFEISYYIVSSQLSNFSIFSYDKLFRKVVLRAWGMAERIKLESLSSIPSKHFKKQGVVVHACKSSQGRQRQAGVRGLLASQLRLIAECQMKETLSQPQERSRQIAPGEQRRPGLFLFFFLHVFTHVLPHK